MEERPHFDRKSTNRAWQEMSLLLDREMPVAARRRRRFAWWWLLAGIGIGLAGLMYFSQNRKAGLPVKISGPVAAVQPDGPSEMAVGKAGVSNETNPAQGQGLPVRDAAKPDSPSNFQPPVSKGPNAKHASDFPISQPGRLEAEDARTAPAPATAEAPALSLGESPRKTNMPSSLGFLSMKSFETKAGSLPALNVAATTKKKSYRAPLTLYASGLATPFDKGDGVAAGMLASFPLGKSRFSIGTGVGYVYIRQPLSILVAQGANTAGGPATNENTGDVTVSFDPLNGKANTLSNNYLLATQDLGLHYLEMPLSILYRANARFHFHVGLNLSMLLASGPDYTRGGVFAENRGTFAATQDQSGSNPGNEAVFSVPISTFDAAGVAGAKYQLTPRLGLGLQYHLGFMDALKSNQGQDYNRLFRASLHYRLR